MPNTYTYINGDMHTRKPNYTYMGKYLGYKTELKAESLFISGTSVHEVTKQQNQLQQT